MERGSQLIHVLPVGKCKSIGSLEVMVDRGCNHSSDAGNDVDLVQNNNNSCLS